MTNLQKKNTIYFIGDLETSGNIINLFSRLGQADHEEPIKFLGLPVAQFFKISADFRRYTTSRKTTLVTRLYAGLGLAYGNLDELPYNRQFIIGGANGLRAFPLRGLGPGSFIREETGNEVIDEQFLDQTGNLKLEFNAEYRYPILGYLKGAIFVDAGNIWLVNNAEIPGGNFKADQFLNEIALGTGLGLRLDFNYFVIRLDSSFALRKPIADDGFKWVIKDFDLLNRQWRKENLQWHLAIGYPF